MAEQSAESAGVAADGITRYRCAGCGNLTRFDVTFTRRTKEFRHFTVGGELEIESVEVLAEDVERVACRWCGADDHRIEVIAPT